MPLFTLTCIDKADALDARMAAREAHLGYVRGRDDVKLGGPFIDAEGKMAGSLLIIEAADMAAAEAFAAADPYKAAGVFESVTIREFRATLGGFAS